MSVVGVLKEFDQKRAVKRMKTSRYKVLGINFEKSLVNGAFQETKFGIRKNWVPLRHALAATSTNARPLSLGFLLLRWDNNAHFLGFREEALT